MRTKKTNPLGNEVELLKLATLPCKEWRYQVINGQRKNKEQMNQPHPTQATLTWPMFPIPSDVKVCHILGVNSLLRVGAMFMHDPLLKTPINKTFVTKKKTLHPILH